MKRLTPHALAAKLLADAIRQYECDPDLRKRVGVDLKQLADVHRIRRRLLKQNKA
jgi:hypothetical protein